MTIRRLVSTRVGSFVVAIALGVSMPGCAEAPDTDEEDEVGADEDLGTVASPQYDPGRWAFTQNGVLVAMVWRGQSASGDTELWAAKPSYDPTLARASTRTSTSCSAFRRTVCGQGWTNATRYRSVYTQSALSCANPPSPINPPQGAISFLGAGSWSSSTGNTPFAQTFVSGNVEYWAMQRPVVGATTQSPIQPYPDFTSFVSATCAMNPVPPIWVSATYVAEPICSVNPC